MKNINLGILLTNLGTPQAPNKTAISYYLNQFLQDPHVIKLPSWLWQPLLKGIVLPFRSLSAVKTYQKIWTEHGSPLLANTIDLKAQLQQHFDTQHISAQFAIGMRYGEPSLESGLDQLLAAGASHILVLPLYPQYSETTTGSTYDEIIGYLASKARTPQLKIVLGYHDNPYYIQAIAQQIRCSWQQQPRGKVLLFSYHGLPEKSVEQGDPYYRQCLQTSLLLAHELQLAEDQWRVVFQSRFGFSPWLQPYCNKTLENLAKQNIDHVDIVCPGFSSDCLETLYEINEQYKQLFLKAGGSKLNYIPALNATPLHVNALSNIILNDLQSWQSQPATAEASVF